jgi:hypothetical protein
MGTFGPYGSFYDTTTQTNTNVGNPVAMTFTTQVVADGVSLVGGSQITVSQAGTYNLAFSAQVTKTDSGTDTIYIWLRVNGIDVEDTSTALILVGNGARQVAAWNFFVPLADGDAAELMWGSIDVRAQLVTEPAGTTPTRPAIPSVIVTINRVGD